MNNEFSNFELKKTSIKFEGDTQAAIAGCVGSLEETMNTKTITKKCEGIVVKKIVKGDGTGELKLSLHMIYSIYLKTFGMVSDGYKDGVYSYGRKSVHKPFCLTAEVLDEDGNKKLKAYPNCVISSGTATKIENGAEEVAEMEVTISVMPDADGQGMYEGLDSELETTVKASWISNFSSTLVEVSA